MTWQKATRSDTALHHAEVSFMGFGVCVATLVEDRRAVSAGLCAGKLAVKRYRSPRVGTAGSRTEGLCPSLSLSSHPGHPLPWQTMVSALYAAVSAVALCHDSLQQVPSTLTSHVLTHTCGPLCRNGRPALRLLREQCCPEERPLTTALAPHASPLVPIGTLPVVWFPASKFLIE